MSSGVFVLSGDGLVSLRETPYDSEALLQGLLAKYPELLAGSYEPEAARWLLVKRELGIPDTEAGGNRWSLDHLFVDQDAVPTLVEVKRSDDTRIRREVVGQMLDYAANGVVYWPADRIRSDFEARCSVEGEDAQDVFRAAFGDDVDLDSFWVRVEQNLRSGRVRLIFVADEIPAELRRVIEFLNERMNPTEVLGIEIRQYAGDADVKTLVPRLVGQTEQARIQKTGSARAPSVDVDWSYYEQSLPAQQLVIVRELYSRMEAAIAEHKFAWQPKLKISYLGFCRPGPYYCCGIGLRRVGAIDFWIKLPSPPNELRSSGELIPDLYPQLGPRWDAANKQMTWKVKSIGEIPDLTDAVELTSRYQPVTGPMPKPK